MSLQLRSLQEADVREIYHRHMAHDFPRAELKPLQRILSAMRDGTGAFVGCYEDEQLCGYAFLMRHKDSLLLDYFAVLHELRGQGLGSHFMQALLESYGNDGLICEIDDPDFAPDEASRTVMLRRQRFYLRNGFRSTGVRVTTFGVHFLLLEPAALPHDSQTIRQRYAGHYRAMLPGWMFRRAIIIPEADS